MSNAKTSLVRFIETFKNNLNASEFSKLTPSTRLHNPDAVLAAEFRIINGERKISRFIRINTKNNTRTNEFIVTSDTIIFESDSKSGSATFKTEEDFIEALQLLFQAFDNKVYSTYTRGGDNQEKFKWSYYRVDEKDLFKNFDEIKKSL